MRYLLDTNAIIIAIDGRNETMRRRMAEADEGDIVTSAIAYAEVALGSEQGRPPKLQVLRTFVEEVPVLPFETAAAELYAKLAFKRGSFDRLIAAHALSVGLILVTANVHDFVDVPGLSVEDWSR